jgi:hypothetical protein
MPSYVEPCLATLAGRPPAGERWVHEIKFDRYRLQLHIAWLRLGQALSPSSRPPPGSSLTPRSSMARRWS